MSKSIMQDQKRCYFCGKYEPLHRHHVFFGTANRKQSEAYGCWVWLCPWHHTDGPVAVHNNPVRDLYLKQQCQMVFEETHTRAEFMQIFGRNWL